MQTAWWVTRAERVEPGDSRDFQQCRRGDRPGEARQIRDYPGRAASRKARVQLLGAVPANPASGHVRRDQRRARDDQQDAAELHVPDPPLRHQGAGVQPDQNHRHEQAGQDQRIAAEPDRVSPAGLGDEPPACRHDALPPRTPP
jgi:hypothetical protein